MLKVYESITALKKATTKRDAERKEMADVIEQEKLVEIKGAELIRSWRSSLIVCRSTSLRAQAGLPETRTRREKDGWES